MTGGFGPGGGASGGRRATSAGPSTVAPSQGPRGSEASKGRAKEGEQSRAEAKHRPLGSGTAADPRSRRPPPAASPRPASKAARSPLRETRRLACTHLSPA